MQARHQLIDLKSAIPCKICGAPSSVFFHSPLFYKHFSKDCLYYTCTECEFQFTTAYDDFLDTDFQTLYSYPEYLEIDEWARMEHIGIGSGRADIQMESLICAQKLSKDSINKVLVLGNGTCRFPALVSQLGIECFHYSPWGWAYDEYAINKECISDYYEYFDCVISAEVYEHFVYPVAEFQNTLRFLRRNGWLIGTTGGIEWYRSIAPMNPSFYLTANPRNGHASFFSERSIDVLATRLKVQNATTRAGQSGHNARKWRVAFSIGGE